MLLLGHFLTLLLGGKKGWREGGSEGVGERGRDRGRGRGREGVGEGGREGEARRDGMEQKRVRGRDGWKKGELEKYVP